MIKVVCWNIERNKGKSWEALRKMDADVALLQEAGEPPSDVELGDQKPWEPWEKSTGWPFGAAVAKLSDRVEVEWFKRVFLTLTEELKSDELRVSDIGMIAAARVRERDPGREPFIAVSMAARWLQRNPTTRGNIRIYSDASAHRIISDLSAFIGHEDPSTHRILAAGDLNVIYGATDEHELALAARERTVFERMDALGLEFLGPQAPNGRRAEPAPKGLPPDTANVPTYYSRAHGGTPETAAWNQLDYVFASRGFHKSVSVRAMNGVDEWGPSDHCRIEIEIA